jgi:hypothetical protein
LVKGEEMTRGRKPKAAHLRAIEGNPGRREIPPEGPEVKGRLVKPKFLTGRPAEIWKQYAPLAHWLTKAETHSFAVWCSLVAEIEAGVGQIPASRLQVFRALSADLGMDLASRARMGIAADNAKTRSDIAKYFDW